MDAEVTEHEQATEILDAFYERFDETDAHDRFLYRPIRETVEAICKDLGLSPDWSRWTGEGWDPAMRPEGRYWELLWAPGIKYFAKQRAKEEAEAIEAAAAALRPLAPRRQ
jgi:hypothetical protein